MVLGPWFSYAFKVSLSINYYIAFQDASSPPPPPSRRHLTDGAATAYELTGVISHIGNSVHVGHYVAHLKKDGRWVIFNDEKVRHVLIVMVPLDTKPKLIDAEFIN